MRRTDPEDTTRSYFRSRERVFCLNGKWFYSTREGDLGPFRSKQEALAEVARFVREKHDLERFQRSRELKAQQPARPAASSAPALSLVPLEEPRDRRERPGKLALVSGR